MWMVGACEGREVMEWFVWLLLQVDSATKESKRRKRFCSVMGSMLVESFRRDSSSRLSYYLHSILLQLLNNWLETMSVSQS